MWSLLLRGATRLVLTSSRFESLGVASRVAQAASRQGVNGLLDYAWQSVATAGDREKTGPAIADSTFATDETLVVSPASSLLYGDRPGTEGFSRSVMDYLDKKGGYYTLALEMDSDLRTGKARFFEMLRSHRFGDFYVESSGDSIADRSGDGSVAVSDQALISTGGQVFQMAFGVLAAGAAAAAMNSNQFTRLANFLPPELHASLSNLRRNALAMGTNPALAVAPVLAQLGLNDESIAKLIATEPTQQLVAAGTLPSFSAKRVVAMAPGAIAATITAASAAARVASAVKNVIPGYNVARAIESVPTSRILSTAMNAVPGASLKRVLEMSPGMIASALAGASAAARVASVSPVAVGSGRWTLSSVSDKAVSISSPYSAMRKLPGQAARPHWGVDLPLPKGSKLYAPGPGFVLTTQAYKGDAASQPGGNTVEVLMLDTVPRGAVAGESVAPGTCSGTVALKYLHCDRVLVTPGTYVDASTPIALSGNTGRVSGKGGGYHLHLEARVAPSARKAKIGASSKELGFSITNPVQSGIFTT